jgi:hypothetical protein
VRLWSQMISVDLSKSLHPRFLQTLVALLPGFFFEGCLFVGDPERMRGIVARTGTSDRYLLALLVIFAAFLIGAATMAWVRLIQVVFARVYFFVSRWWPKKLDHLEHAAARKAAVRPLEPGHPPKPESRYLRFLRLLWLKQRRREVLQRHVQSAWVDVAMVLLKRYGIEEPEPHAPWSEVLGRWRPEQVRGDLLSMAMHAVGWAGLAARHFAPALHLSFSPASVCSLSPWECGKLRVSLGLWRARSRPG